MHTWATRRIDRRTLLGATHGSGRRRWIAPLPAWAQDAPPISGDITYWHHFTSDSEMVGLEQVTALFAKQYPKVTVTSENIPNADFMTQFTTAAVGGSLPDTTMAAAERIPDMLALGGLVDLTERYNGWEGSSSIDPGLMDGATIDGKIYGIPAFLFVDWLYYRKDWFDEAGIAPPTTWDELRDSGNRADRRRERPLWLRLARRRRRPGPVVGIMRAYGGLSADENGVPVIDRDKAIEAVTFWSGLYTTDKVAPPSAPNDSYSQIMQAFRTGQTAMVLHHTGSLAEISADLTQGKQFMTTLVPAGPVMQVAGVSALYNGMCKEDDGDASWAWLTEWTDARCRGPVPGDHRLLPGLVGRRCRIRASPTTRSTTRPGTRFRSACRR